MMTRIRTAISHDTDKGFTLVELLVVVVILVALAAIAVPIFLNQAQKANVAAAKSSVSTAASALSNGLGTGGTAFGSTATATTITVVDGTGATITVPNPGTAKLNALAVGAWPTATPGAVIASYCVSVPNPEVSGSFLRMTNSDAAPVDGLICA